MVGIHKRKRNTFNRRLKALIKTINPRISEFFNKHPGNEAECLNMQIERLKELIAGTPSMFIDQDNPVNVSNQIEPYSFWQKVRLNKVENKRRITSEV